VTGAMYSGRHLESQTDALNIKVKRQVRYVWTVWYVRTSASAAGFHTAPFPQQWRETKP